MFFHNFILIKSYAKINIGLAVTGKREDGYHNIETVMQSVNLFDIIKIRERQGKTEIICSKKEVPSGNKNLIYKVIKILKERHILKKDFEVEILKNIPTKAGLGGASSNAANVLIALNRFYRLNLGYRELLNIAKEVGSDVCFFLKGGTAFIEGRGEVVKKLSPLSFQAVVVKPDFSIPTSWAYKNIKEYSEKGKIKNILNLVKNRNMENFKDFLENDFEKILKIKYPEIENIKKEFIKYGAIFSSLTGTGSAIFGIVKNRFQAEEIKRKFLKKYQNVFLVKTTCKGGEIIW